MDLYTKPHAAFDGPTVPFFSKVLDFFAAESTYITNERAYADATGDENPFKGGSRPTGQPLRFTQTVESPTERVITATFQPLKPTDVCRAWTSLATYCGNEGEACACYSGTYYVPDQWNSLAARCAVLTTRCASSTEDPWCQVGRTASDYTGYCTDDASAVRFAARANIRSADATPTTDSAPASDSETTSDAPTATETPSESDASSSARTTLGSTSNLNFPLPTSSTGLASASSWSPRSLDPAIVKRYSQVFVMVNLAILFRDYILPVI